jgi:hypothetical protein
MSTPRYTAIELGSTICSKLKQIYHPNEKWADCYKKVGALLTIMKKNARKFYIDKTDEEILKDLNKYTNDDIVELLTMGNKNET